MKTHGMGGWAWVCALGLGLSACGGWESTGLEDGGEAAGSSSSSSSSSGGSSGTGSSGGGIHQVVAEASGALTGSGIAAAMQWRAYPQRLLDCLEPINVTRQLNPENPADERTWANLAFCAQLYAFGRVAADGVALPPDSTAFTVPVAEVPAPALVTGAAGEAMGLGAVLVFLDGNGNGKLDMVTPGALESVDTVLGASVGVEETSTTDTFVLWRQGAVSPLWKLFVGLYGCPDDPPEGFSVLQLGWDDFTFLPSCSLRVDGVVPVTLSSTSAMRNLVCLPTDTGPPYRYPDAPLPAGAVAQCLDEYTLYFTTTPDSVCPILEHYDLLGCSNIDSPVQCQLSTWDLTDNPPAWWPCSGGGGNGANLRFQDEPADVTDGLDALFTLQHRGGTASIPLSALRVDVTVTDAGGTVELLGENLVLVDADNNGVFSAGDDLQVREVAVSLFGLQTEPGYYPVALMDMRVTPPRMLGSFQWTPLPLPAPAGETFEVRITDHPAPLTDGPDALFQVEMLSGPRPLRLADLQVDVAYSCEAPYPFAGTEQLVLEDGNGNGAWDAGERLTVRETLDAQFFGAHESLHFHCISISVRRGFNVREQVAYGSWEMRGFQVEDHPDAVTADAGGLFTVRMTLGFDTFQPADVVVDVYSMMPGHGSTLLHAFTAAAGEVILLDTNADGLLGLDDALEVRKVMPVPGLDAGGQYLVLLRTAEGQYLSSGLYWEALN